MNYINQIKNSFHLLGISIILLISNGCGEDFLASPPDGQITIEEFMGTPAAAQEALNGAYRVLGDGSSIGGLSWLLAEVMADNIDGTRITNGDWLSHYNWNTDIFLGTTRTLMEKGALVYGRANFVIDHLDLAVGLTAAERERITAECKFLRAIIHFELVRMFAQPYGFTADNSHPGIAIRTSYSKEKAPRATVGEVFAQVITDLEEAMNVLPANNNRYATSWAAKGYLAKVYFQMNDYQQAFAMANDVIENSGLQFDPNIFARFSEMGTSESVFDIVSTGQNNNSGGALSGYFRVGGDGTAQTYISENMYNNAAVDTTRFKIWYAPNSSGAITLNKFVSDNSSWMQVPIIHITELKLIRGESAAEINNNIPLALEDLNDIRGRAGMPNFANSDPIQVVNSFRLERRRELVAEGNRLHELKRIGAATERGLTVLPVTNLEIRGVPWNCNGMICQFPDSELSGNLDLEANPTNSDPNGIPCQ